VDGSTHAMGCGLKGGCCTQAVAFQSNLGTRGGDIYEDGSSQPLRTVAPPAVAFKPSHYTRGKDGAPSDVAAPLSADADKGDQDTVVAFTKSKPAQSTTDDETWVPGEVSPTMSCFDQGDTRATTVVAFRENTRCEVGYVDPPQSLESGGGKPRQGYCGVQIGMAVRRLTPRECERLQGFPDDYTMVEYRKKPAADGPRYRALGNSMAVPVMRWIGERIAVVDAMP
jgi:DNA (cytosine-5)-methyltransferase 1